MVGQLIIPHLHVTYHRYTIILQLHSLLLMCKTILTPSHHEMLCISPFFILPFRMTLFALLFKQSLSSSVNDGIPQDIYLGEHFKLHFKWVDDEKGSEREKERSGELVSIVLITNSSIPAPTFNSLHQHLVCLSEAKTVMLSMVSILRTCDFEESKCTQIVERSLALKALRMEQKMCLINLAMEKMFLPLFQPISGNVCFFNCFSCRE